MTTKNFRVRKGLTIAGETSGSSNFNNSATGTDIDYVLPTAQGAANTTLTNDGSGNLSWALPGGGGSTFGNITIAVDTDNTISTTTGDLLLDSVGDIVITGGVFPAVVTDPSPSVLTLESGQTTLSLNGGTGFDDSVLTLTNSALQWAHSAGMVIGSVNGTWSWNADGTTDFPNYTFPYADGTTDQILKTNGSGILSWFSPTDLNTTYTIDASVATGGADLNLVGSDSTTDTIKFAGGTNVTITATDANTITIDAPDTNTTYDFNASSASGGANLNLVGSDSTTDTVKLSDGGHITATYTSATEVTLGSDATDANTASTIVARDASGNFSASGATLGNITIGVDTDNTIASTDTNGNIILDPNGTGDIVLTLADGGNLTNSRNYVAGAIRNSTVEANGDMWGFLSGSGTGYRGISIDNSADTTKGPLEVIRGFTGGASAPGAIAPRVLFERARGTSASPTAIQSGDVVGQIAATGANGAGTFIGDAVAAQPASLQFLAAETFSGTTNVGTQLSLSLMPTGKTLASTASPTVVFGTTPQGTTQRSDSFTWQNGNTIANANQNTKMTLNSTGQLAAYGNLTALGTLTFNNELAVDARSELLDSNTSAGTTLAIQTNYRPSSGSATYSVPQAGNKLGNFRFNSYSDSSGTYALANQVSAYATENWTPTANGSGIQFFGNKQGQSWTTGHTSLATLTPEGTSYSSENFIFENLAGTDNLTIDVSGNVVIAGDLRINGNDIKASDGNTAITLSPITGYNPNSDFTGNIVKGAIRTGAGEATGDIWQIGIGPSAQTTGISVDNTDKPSDRTGLVLRNYASSPRNIIVAEAARGTAAAPTNLNNGNLIFDIIGNGYTSTGWITDQVAAAPAGLRFTTSEAWNNGLNNVGTSFAVTTHPTATTITGLTTQTTLVANPQTFNMRSDIYNWSKGKTNNAGMMSLNDQSGKVTLSVNQNRATSGSDFPITNFTTQRSTDGINYTPTQANDNLGSFKFNGNAYTGTSPGVPGGPGAEILAQATENWTSTANGTRFNFFAMKTGTLNSYKVFGGNPDSFEINSDITTINNFDNSVNYATFNATSATFTQPVGFPVNTAANWNAITGAVGQQVCVSDSAGGGNPNGMMAFWDTTNSRWSYIHDNSAV